MAGWTALKGWEKAVLVASAVGAAAGAVWFGLRPQDDGDRIAAVAPPAEVAAMPEVTATPPEPATAEPAPAAADPAETEPALAATAAPEAAADERAETDAAEAVPGLVDSDRQTDAASDDLLANVAAAETEVEAAEPELTAAEPAAVEAAQPPVFDTVRHGADGGTVIAGRAAPGAEISVLVDGQEADRVRADRTGAFASVFGLPAAGAPRVVTLRAYLADGSALPGGDSVILAPSARPPEVPEAPAAVADAGVASVAAPEVAVRPDPQAAPAEAMAEAPPPPVEALAAIRPDDEHAEVELAFSEEALSDEPEDMTAEPTPEPEPAVPSPTAETGAAEAVPLVAVEAEHDASVAGIAESAAPAAQVEQPASPEVPPVTAAAPAAPEAAGVPAAAAPPPVLLAGDEGVRVLDPAPSFDLVIDLISYDGAGAVSVSGRGGAGSVVRIYVDNALAAEAQAGADGRWQAGLPDVAPGLHRLRADQVDDAGRVTARFDTPFRREAPETLDAVAPQVGDAAETLAQIITVQPGNTLWGIARASYGEGILYVHVFEANRDQIRNPDLIYPGQVFTVPDLPPAD